MVWATNGKIGEMLVKEFNYPNKVASHMDFFASVKQLSSPSLVETRKKIRSLFGDTY
eukprot:TRINITY_DN1948_c0_g1_i1.p1 TRINITY_DN1948_c0_g1~~TRINITY_DN1948_c0_g1_i1.p1  ORF type:complete len:57 (-),score=9.16 TRINITY_DN1948_c0_g1_i1:423-593(-)